MDPIHLHLTINHLPVIGPWLAIPLLALALWLPRERGLLLAATVVLGMSAVGGLVSERTGEAAEAAIEDRALTGFEEDLIEAHEHRAEGSVALLAAAAMAAVAATVYVRSSEGTAPRWMIAGLLVLTVAGAGAMGWTAQAGAWIRHPELQGRPALEP